MSYLEIDFGGERRRVELDRRQPLSIGRHASNDISLRGDDVEPMHCRIGWNKASGYEVHAAAAEGVDVNGTLVQRASLTDGDVLHIGAANVLFCEPQPSVRAEDDAVAESREPVDSLYALKPLTSEFELPSPSPSLAPPAPPAVPLSPSKAPEDNGDDPPLTANEILPDEADERPVRRKPKRRREREAERPRDRKREPSPSEPSDFDILQRLDLSDGQSPSREAEDAGSPHSLRERLRTRALRPGERDPVRSPLVLTLGGGAFVLALVGATFYFILSRQTTQAQFDMARSLMDEGKYAQAITQFEKFLTLYPRNPLADEAEVQMWIARIERQAGGASPNWPQAMDELEGFINARRDDDRFEDLHEVIRKQAETIAQGAAATAGATYDRELLAVSRRAENLLKAYAPRDAPPTDAQRRIESARRSSEAAILKHEAFTGALAEIDAALADRETMGALATRRQLLTRYPEFLDDSAVEAKLSQTLNIERELVARSDEPAEALMDDRESPYAAVLTLASHARSRTDEVSVGRTVIGLAKDCCYAVDSITGEPVWRRAIGWETPFFPIDVAMDVPSLLLYDTNVGELLLLDQRTGELKWRQPEVTDVQGVPLVDEGQVYLATASGSLMKVDLDTGRVLSRLQFSQPISSPVALNDGNRLAVCGDQEVIYTLTKRPLECVAVSFLGHQPGSVAAPLLAMGGLLLVAENQPGEEALVHVLDTRSEAGRLVEAARRTVPGHVVDAPVIRGRDLFVPSSGGRINSFFISDERGQPPLTVGPRYEAQGSGHGPVFLATGPDRQVWMAGRNLRKLQLTADAIQSGQQFVNLGRATQELQQLGNKVFVGRSPLFASAVSLLQLDRDTLASHWQAVLGGRLLACAPFPDGEGLIAVSEAGDVYRVSAAQLAEGGFATGTTMRLRLPDGLDSPLEAARFDDTKLAVWCHAPEPQLWIINSLGQIERRYALDDGLEAPPVPVGSRLALPLPGRIRLLQGNPSPPGVQDFMLPLGESESSRWRQLVPVDEATLLAVDASGHVRLLRVKEASQAYLAEDGSLDMGGAMDFAAAYSEGRVAAAVAKQLRLIDATTLEPLAEVELEQAVSNGPWLSAGMLFAETARSALHCFATESGDGPELTHKWSIALPNCSLSGAPVVAHEGSSVIVTLLDGTLLAVDAETGEITRQDDLRQSLSSGAERIGSQLVVATDDGSLVLIGSESDTE